MFAGLMHGQQSAEKESVDLYLGIIGSDKPAVRLKAVQKLGNFGLAGRSAAPALGVRLDDADDKVADVAARSLAQIGPGGVSELVRGTLSDKPSVRYRCVWALGLMGPDAKD